MKKVLSILALSVVTIVLVLAPLAWAADVQGKIKSVDVAQRIVVLEDGTMIWLSEGIVIDALQEGKSVKAAYEEREGKKVATSVEVSE